MLSKGDVTMIYSIFIECYEQERDTTAALVT